MTATRTARRPSVRFEDQNVFVGIHATVGPSRDRRIAASQTRERGGKPKGGRIFFALLHATRLYGSSLPELTSSGGGVT